MKTRNALIAIFAVVIVMVSGYFVVRLSTKPALAAMDARIEEQRIYAARSLAALAKQNPTILQSGDVQLYVSAKLLGDALKLIDGIKVKVAEKPNWVITLNSAKPRFSPGRAGVVIDASVSDGTTTVSARGFGELRPRPLKAPAIKSDLVLIKMLPGGVFGNIFSDAIEAMDPRNWSLPDISEQRSVPKSPEPLKLLIDFSVTEIEADVSYLRFSTSMPAFLGEFAELKLNQVLTEKVPAIEIPVENSMALDQAAQDIRQEVADGALVVRTVLPPVHWRAGFALQQPVILERGIHLSGTLQEGGPSDAK